MTGTGAVEWAFEQKAGNAAAKLVLLTLARHVGEDWSCILTQEELAGETDQSRASVIRALRTLVSGGLVEREARRDEWGHRVADRYRLLVPESLSCNMQHGSDLPELQSANLADPYVADCDSGKSQSDPDLPVYQSATRSYVTDPYVANCNSLRSSPTENTLFPSPTGKGGVGGNQTSSSAKKLEEHPGFAEWYAAYPVHKARGAAVKAYTKAAAKTDPVTLLAAAQRYRDDEQVRRGYGKHPATWLNQDCWLDEPARAPGFAPTGTDSPRASVNDQWKDRGFGI